MAWPPPTLPVNRTNATPQLDTHPADHNAVNLAVNDIVAKMVAFPLQSGTATAVTNASGVGNWSFNAFFPSGTTPVVVAVVQSAAALGLSVVIRSVTTGGFAAAISNPNGTAFVGSVSLSWIASGNRRGFDAA